MVMLYYWIKNKYYSIRSVVKYLIFNKAHWSTVWTAMKSYNWDYGYLDEILRCKLIEMRNYFQTSKIAIKDYEGIVRDINTCIKLLDILTNKVEVCHLEGEFLSENSKIVCDVYVNLRNANRFLYLDRYSTFPVEIKTKKAIEKRKEEILDAWRRYPDELYKVKARYLLNKILNQRAEMWWD